MADMSAYFPDMKNQMKQMFEQYDGKIGIVLGPGKYDGPNKESKFYEVLVGTIKMTVKDESLEEA